jgi:hypothetical protein
MLVLDMKGEFHKKATAHTFFTCHDGVLLEQAIRAAIEQQQPQTCTARSVGLNSEGEAIATFHITWTFKVKAK